MSKQQPKQSHWSPAWVTIVAALGSVAVVLAMQAHLLPVSWWGFPVFGAAGAAMTMLVTLAQGGWIRTHLYRSLAWLSAGAWTAWATVTGWTQPVWMSLVGGTLILAGLSYVCATPEEEQGAQDPGAGDRRPKAVREWEALLRRLTKAPVTVTAVVPWDIPGDGERVHIDLPDEGDITAQRIVDIRGNIAVARQLPPGCSVRVDDGDHQGQVVLDVMLRDCLTDSVGLESDYSPTTIYADFQVMTSPRGESLEVCLRSHSMVIGGAPDSGKTTLLHRVILFLARCTDTLIWVVDANGGGVATPWVRPWAMGKAGRPIVDWVAPDEEEGAVLIAVATAIAKDRKTSREAVRRKHDQNTTVLPVDEKLPAIVVLNDEGGEMRQAVSLLGQIADQGISRLAQIGRAEAVRAVKSVLRGTSDLLDKGMRVCAPLRICLRMEEEGEYVHVLGEEPGKTKLLHKGTGFLRRSGDPRPILARTVNVLLSQIEDASIACAGLRPDLDERGRLVAGRLRVRDVLGGRDPASYPDILALPVMQDVEAGRAYEGRWERRAAELAAMRGEELPEPGDDLDGGPAEPASAPEVKAAPSATSAIAALSAAVGAKPKPETVPAGQAKSIDVTDQSAVEQVFGQIAEQLRGEIDWTAKPQRPAGQTVTEQQSERLTTRQRVVGILHDAYPELLTPSQIGARLKDAGAEVSRTYLQDLLKVMVTAGEIVRPDEGQYTVEVER